MNSKAPADEYGSIAKTGFFVDKSSMIDELMEMVTKDGQRYFCITRPRRFGKSVIANMFAFFFSRAVDGKEVFQELAVSESVYYQKHLNRHDVLRKLKGKLY